MSDAVAPLKHIITAERRPCPSLLHSLMWPNASLEMLTAFNSLLLLLPSPFVGSLNATINGLANDKRAPPTLRQEFLHCEQDGYVLADPGIRYCSKIYGMAWWTAA